MKNVTFSEIVRVPSRVRSLFWRYGASAAAGSMPGRLHVTTRFQACHLVGTLDDAMAKLGYAPATRAPGSLRYRTRNRGGLLAWTAMRPADIDVTVRPHTLEVTGPVAALHALRIHLAF